MPKYEEIDPEVRRFARDYPTFPGIAVCVHLLEQPNVKGAYLDALLAQLGEHMEAYVIDLIDATRMATSVRVQTLLLSVLAERGHPACVALFQEALQNPELAYWGTRGLQRINTKETRRILHEQQGEGQ